MADKGFDIGDDLNKIDLKLNILPFLKDQAGFNEGDVLKTQTIARHRIHVERAIGKVRRFRIFHSVIPVSMFGSVNQIWTVACLLSNFQNPVLALCYMQDMYHIVTVSIHITYLVLPDNCAEPSSKQ